MAGDKFRSYCESYIAQKALRTRSGSGKLPLQPIRHPIYMHKKWMLMMGIHFLCAKAF